MLFTNAPRSFLARPSLLPRGFVGTARGFLALTTQLLFDARMLLLGAPIARFAALALVLVAAPRFVVTPALLGFRLRLGIASRLRLAGLLLKRRISSCCSRAISAARSSALRAASRRASS